MNIPSFWPRRLISSTANTIALDKMKKTKTVDNNKRKHTEESDVIKDESDPPISKKVKVKNEDKKEEQEEETVLRGLLDCPICLEPMLGSIYQCGNGHMVCGKCKTGLVKCHTCNLYSTENRNLALEKMAEVEYPVRKCPNLEHGCFEEFKIAELGVHTSLCSFKPYKCPIRFHGNTSDKSCDQTFTASELSKHLASKHGKMTTWTKDDIETKQHNGKLHFACEPDRGKAAYSTAKEMQFSFIDLNGTLITLIQLHNGSSRSWFCRHITGPPLKYYVTAVQKELSTEYKWRHKGMTRDIYTHEKWELANGMGITFPRAQQEKLASQLNANEPLEFDIHVTIYMPK